MSKKFVAYKIRAVKKAGGNKITIGDFSAVYKAGEYIEAHFPEAEFYTEVIGNFVTEAEYNEITNKGN